jgi:hypothetical protein
MRIQPKYCKIIVTGLLMSIIVWSQLPSAKQVASQMKVSWNPGNSLNVICCEIAYGFPNTIQTLTSSVKTSGFKAVWIHCKCYNQSTKCNSLVNSYLINLSFTIYNPVMPSKLSHSA